MVLRYEIPHGGIMRLKEFVASLSSEQTATLKKLLNKYCYFLHVAS